MKRYLSLLLALCLCLSLFACNKDPQSETPVDPPQNEQPEDPVADPQPTPSDPVPPDPPADPDPEPAPPTAPIVAMRDKHYTYQIYDHNENESSDATAVLCAEFTIPAPAEMDQITAYYETVKTDLFNIYAAEAGDAILQKQGMASYGDEFRPWAMEMTFEVLRNDGTVLSILRELYENRNAAHPLVVYFAETFAVESQGRLLLGDLFTVSEDEYLPRLRDMIVAQMDEREANEGMPYFDYARDQLLSLLDPMDFALTEDSLLLFFDVYALAPYVAGPQHFELPLSELSDILDTRWVKE